MKKLIFTLLTCLAFTFCYAQKNQDTDIEFLFKQFVKDRDSDLSNALYCINSARFKAEKEYGNKDSRTRALGFVHMIFAKKHYQKETAYQFSRDAALGDRTSSDFSTSLMLCMTLLDSHPLNYDDLRGLQLLEIQNILDSIPNLSYIDKDLKKYYSSIGIEMNKKIQVKIEKQVKDSISALSSDNWQNAVLHAAKNMNNIRSTKRDKETYRKYVYFGLELLKSRNYPDYCSLLSRLNLYYPNLFTIEEKPEELYRKSAEKQGIWGIAGFSKLLIDQGKTNEAMHLLNVARTYPNYTVSGCAYQMGRIYEHGCQSFSVDTLKALDCYTSSAMEAYNYEMQDSAIKASQRLERSMVFNELENQRRSLNPNKNVALDYYILAKGYEGIKEYEHALSLYATAAEMGDVRSMNTLGLYYYENGFEDEEMMKKSAGYFQKGSEASYLPCFYNNLIMNLYGLGIPVDLDKVTNSLKEYPNVVELNISSSGDFKLSDFIKLRFEYESSVNDVMEVIALKEITLALNHYEKAMKCYNEANDLFYKAKIEASKKQQDVLYFWNLHQWAANNGHPWSEYFIKHKLYEKYLPSTHKKP